MITGLGLSRVDAGGCLLLLPGLHAVRPARQHHHYPGPLQMQEGTGDGRRIKGTVS